MTILKIKSNKHWKRLEIIKKRFNRHGGEVDTRVSEKNISTYGM